MWRSNAAIPLQGRLTGNYIAQMQDDVDFELFEL